MSRAADKARGERGRTQPRRGRAGPPRGAGSRALRRHGVRLGHELDRHEGAARRRRARGLDALALRARGAADVALGGLARRADALRGRRPLALRGERRLMFSLNLMLFLYAALYLPSGLLAVVFSLVSIVNL